VLADKIEKNKFKLRLYDNKVKLKIMQNPVAGLEKL
jgi:hypothetical protein